MVCRSPVTWQHRLVNLDATAVLAHPRSDHDSDSDSDTDMLGVPAPPPPPPRAAASASASASSSSSSTSAGASARSHSSGSRLTPSASDLLIEPATLELLDKVQGATTTKLAALLELLQAVPDGEKAVVFTNFGVAVPMITALLEAHKIGFVYIVGSSTQPKRAQALTSFTNEPSVKVMVLNIRSAAVGLTLTAANHLVFLEPGMQPSLYQQAIGRVHRLGQTRPVQVTTLVGKGTVEETVEAWMEKLIARQGKASQAVGKRIAGGGT